MNESSTVVKASAPGKMVLLGEHSVVYGKPAIAIAIDRRFTCTVRSTDVPLINGTVSNLNSFPHIRSILASNECGPVALDTESDVPPSSGLGSSAALSCSFSAAVRSLIGKRFDRETTAREAFDAEYTAQGRASPMDTSCSANGHGIVLNCPDGMGKHLWTVERNGNTWDISSVPVPKMTFVIGCTGIRAATGPLVEKVRRYRAHNRFAADIVDEIGKITIEGMEAMQKNDVEHLGRLMSYDHKLLSILGVSCHELNRLVDAASVYSYGAKLTGSGGGGSMIALTDRPEKVCETIALHGGTPFVVNTDVEGVRLENYTAGQ
jgi:mevalonate kinase